MADELDLHQWDVIEVVWDDAWAAGEWEDHHRPKPKKYRPERCKTVGYFYEQNDEAFVVMGSRAGKRGFGGVSVIPVGMVVSVRKVVE